MDHIALAVAKNYVDRALRMPAENLVTNGDFSESDGTIGTGWVAGAAITNLSIVDGVQYFTGAGTIAASVGNQFYTPSVMNVPDHVYYVTVTARRTDGGDGGLIYCGSSFRDFLGGGTLTQEWVRYSGTGTRHPTNGHRFAIGASSGVPVAVRHALCIDLTAIFGAGNEPTAQEMDALLAQFDGGWFNGMQYLFNPGHVLGYLLREIRDLKSAVVSLGGGV